MNICIAGKNNIAVKSLEYLILSKIININDIFVCPIENDLGMDTWQLSLRKFAEVNNLKIIKLNELYDIENLVFISLEYDKIIKPSLFKTKKLFNIHFSHLPKYKGMFTSIWPILNGELRSGVTLHKIDSGIDTGDIIAQYKFDIDINDTARDLYFKYLDYGLQLFKDFIKNIVNNNYSYIKQPYLNSSYYSKNSIDFNNIKIDLIKTSFEIHNQIRAFIFPEYQLPMLNGHYLTKSELINEKIDAKYYEKRGNKIILSGVDSYKVILDVL